MIQVWYGLYGVAGLRGANDLDFASLRTLYYTDNNSEPAGGARVSFTYASDAGSFFGDISVGASGDGRALRPRGEARLPDVRRGRVDAARPVHAPRRVRRAQDGHRPDASGYKFAVVDPYVIRRAGTRSSSTRSASASTSSTGTTSSAAKRRAAPRAPPSRRRACIVRYTAGLVLVPVAEAVYVKLAWEYWSNETMIGTPAGTTPFQAFHSDPPRLRRSLLNDPRLVRQPPPCSRSSPEPSPRRRPPIRATTARAPWTSPRGPRSSSAGTRSSSVKCAKCHPFARTVNSHFSTSSGRVHEEDAPPPELRHQRGAGGAHLRVPEVPRGRRKAWARRAGPTRPCSARSPLARRTRSASASSSRPSCSWRSRSASRRSRSSASRGP